ncbi:hypothetical protein PIB30_062194 [Stylosanthes scabra]|uniref:Uncharacterized protein n=1 Tax=Stylosanthes scabra TaxID=79078 RepID=A0ABU6TM06_9FABA|nr:hypothetical protein [Stylosanthes scabra]
MAFKFCGASSPHIAFNLVRVWEREGPRRSGGGRPEAKRRAEGKVRLMASGGGSGLRLYLYWDDGDKGGGGCE